MSVFGFLDNDCSNITQAATVHSEWPSAYRGYGRGERRKDPV